MNPGRPCTLMLTALVCTLAVHGQTTPTTGSVRGLVRTKKGGPVKAAKVTVRQPGTGLEQSVETATDGSFTLGLLAEGTYELTVTASGLQTVKDAALPVAGGQALTRNFSLDAEAQAVVEVVFDSLSEPLSFTQLITAKDNTELQNLSTALGNDPFRAVQNLPGVTASDDFYGQFAVRGAGPRHIGVVIDGVLVDQPVHGFTDQGDLGSVSIINGNAVETMALMSGAYSAKFGGRTGATLDVETRDGARDKTATRVDADMLSLSATTEGPLGKEGRGSYFVSARQSYLQYLTSKLQASGVSMGYGDLDLKFVYDLAEHHRLSFTTLLGYSKASRDSVPPGYQSESYLSRGFGRQDLSTLRWTWNLSPATTSQAQVFWTRDTQTQHNPNDRLLLDSTSSQVGLKETVTHELSAWQSLEAGLSARRLSSQLYETSLWNYTAGTLAPALLPVANFSQSSSETGVYLQDTLRLLGERLKVRLAGRWDHAGATGETVFQPRFDATFSVLPKTQVAFALGQYAQLPTADNLYGKFGTSGLKAEKATTSAVSLDHLFSDHWRLHVELYNRSERNVIYSPETQFRLRANGAYALPKLGAVLTNSLEGSSRGLEVMLQGRSTNGLSGWVSFSRNFTQYRQPETGQSFWGDYDQRNTLTAYCSYRLSDTLSLSANGRYGSGTPVPGYVTAMDGSLPTGPGGSGPSGGGSGSATLLPFALAATPNGSRIPSYQRIDLRLNKVFNRDRYKLTVKFEIDNILNHNNWRYYDYQYPVAGTGTNVLVTRNTTMPRLPVVGVSVQF